MKIVLLILLSMCAFAVNSEYPRFKRRGPPQPPRPPPMGPHTKIRQPPSNFPGRVPNRPRPIPVHMPVAHKIPLGAPQQKPRPVAPPVRNFWKNNQGIVKINHAEKEKPFHSSQALNTIQEYDYHIQSNSIPTMTNTIKQVGEKGPIHTIPAPNLSPADRPIAIEKPHKHHEQKYHTSPYIKVEPSVPQYQVTETSEPVEKLKYYKPKHEQIQQLTKQEYQELQKQQQLFQIEYQRQLTNAQKQQYYIPDAAPQQSQYQIVEMYPKQLQTQAIQTSFFQQQPTYQYHNIQTAEPAHSTVEKSINVEPEYHSFNYDEQAHRKTQSIGTSLVTAGYNLDADAQASETVLEGVSTASTDRNVVADTLNHQSQMVQSYFETRREDTVQPDAKTSSSEKPREEGIPVNVRYSSLPNKDVADRLAQLQAAGKVNSNLMKISGEKVAESQNPMRIYVPDEEHEENKDGESVEYDEFSQEVDDGEDFGHKIQPKKKRH